MATITITIAGSGIVADSTKAYSINDTDLQSVISWSAAVYGGQTNQQVLLAWLQNQLINPTIINVRNFQRAAPPSPIIIS